jgi:hypothetical protein
MVPGMSGVPSVESAYRAVRARTRDLLLLDRAEREVRARRPEQQELVRRYHAAAVRRAAVADELTDDRGAVAALVLYREAAALLVAALAVTRDPEASAGGVVTGVPWDVLDELARAGAVPSPPTAIEEARRTLTAVGPLVFDHIPASELLARRATVESVVRWLRDQIEPRTLQEIHTSRALRVAGAALLLIALVYYAVRPLFRPNNVALHKPVTLSQRHPESTAPADNSGLVNGEIERSYGIHTIGTGGWVMVDLLGVYNLREVRVYNRADEWFDQGLPFRLELSEDGTHFNVAEERKEPFSSTSPWVFHATGQRARFVRISSKTYVALTELEVDGKKLP